MPHELWGFSTLDGGNRNYFLALDDLWGLFPVIFLGDGSCTCTETQGAPLQISGLLLCKVLYTLVHFPMMSSSLPLWTPSSISSTQGDLGSPSGFPIPVLCCKLPLGSELGSHRAHSVCFPSLRDHCPLLLISISVYVYVYVSLSLCLQFFNCFRWDIKSLLLHLGWKQKSLVWFFDPTSCVLFDFGRITQPHPLLCPFMKWG